MSERLTIGSPVRRRVIEMNGILVEWKWKPATVCYLPKDRHCIGVAYADGKREMCQREDLDLLGAQL